MKGLSSYECYILWVLLHEDIKPLDGRVDQMKGGEIDITFCSKGQNKKKEKIMSGDSREMQRRTKRSATKFASYHFAHY